MTAVPYLFQRDELRKLGATQVIALTPEGTLSFGRSVLGELGSSTDDIDIIISSLRADDYASMRGGGGTIPEDVPQVRQIGKDRSSRQEPILESRRTLT